jgi:hypothetical protein
VRGQVGGQINDLVGVYATPSLGPIFGSFGGVSGAVGAMVDFTFANQVLLGAGPEAGFIAGGEGGGDAPIGDAAGFYGGRLHVGYVPLLSTVAGRPRRDGLELSADLRLLLGDTGGDAFPGRRGQALILSPTVGVGFLAF